MPAVGIVTGHRCQGHLVQQQTRVCSAGPCAPPRSVACSSRPSKRRVVVAAFPNDPGSWGEQIRQPDATYNLDDQDTPGPLSDVDQEWQEFISGRGKFTQPQPLLWDSDTLKGSSWPPSTSSSSSGSNSSSNGSAPDGSNRGSEASSSGRYSSSIQSFDDWDSLEGDFAFPMPLNMPCNEALPRTSTSSSNSTSSSSSNPATAASIHSLLGGAGVDGLRSAALQPTRDRSPAEILSGRGLWQDMREVYVLLFGVGQKDTEGIYSLRAVSEDGLPTETIIAFENMDDAVRYAALLEATMEHCPHVCSIPPAELMAFCSDSGYRCRLELEGSMLMPPEYNVHVTDWERSLRLREGKFNVLQEEPEYTVADAIDSAMTYMGMQKPSMNMGGMNMNMGMAGYSLSRDSPFNAQPGEFSASELDTLKAQLEALLPDGSMDSRDDAASGDDAADS